MKRLATLAPTIVPTIAPTIAPTFTPAFARGLAPMLALVALASGGCTAEWDTGSPVIPLTGTPPSPQSLRKLNTMHAGLAAFIQGPDDAWWTAFCEFSTGNLGGARGCRRMHLVRLDDQAGDEVLLGDDFVLSPHTVFVMRDDVDVGRRDVFMHHPGDGAGGVHDVGFSMPGGTGFLRANTAGDCDVFVYQVLDRTTTHFDVFRRDRAYQRRFALPAGVDPAQPPPAGTFDLQLTADGNTLVLRGADGTMTANSTLGESTIALGTRPPDFFIDNDRRALVTIGADGFRSVPLGGGADRVLAPTVFDPATLALSTDTAWYALDGNLHQVPLDGSAADAIVQRDAERLLALGPNGELAYSRDPGTRFAGGAGSGWVGDWNPMERGRRMRFSGDGRRIRFLEHAATPGVVGDLTSARMPDVAGGMGGAPETLALNVHQFSELPDGRVLAIENHVFAGIWNRLVVIDESARTRAWVVQSAHEFFLVPDGGDIVVDVVTGASGYDIVRVPPP